MAILVSFFAGDSPSVNRCLESGGWPPSDPAAECSEEVSFKLGLIPERAFNALVQRAAQLANVESFDFEECVSGTLAQDGESFRGSVTGRFIELFAMFPRQLLPELATQWSAELARLCEAEYPPVPNRTPTRWGQVRSNLRQGIETAIMAAVLAPILAVAMLSPSFRKERRLNKKKLVESKPYQPPTTEDLLSALISVCAAAKNSQDGIVYAWHI